MQVVVVNKKLLIVIMFYLNQEEEIEALKYIQKSVKIAKKATCTRSKCWSVIVKNWEIIWTWYNSAPWELESQCRCTNSKDSYNKKVTDKTCCIHAEQRAIMDALKTNASKIKDSRLYFIRLDENDKQSFAWNPYCTICSKMSLDVWIKEFVLYHKDWICVYNTEEYNDLSYAYNW